MRPNKAQGKGGGGDVPRQLPHDIKRFENMTFINCLVLLGFEVDRDATPAGCVCAGLTRIIRQ